MFLAEGATALLHKPELRFEIIVLELGAEQVH